MSDDISSYFMINTNLNYRYKQAPKLHYYNKYSKGNIHANYMQPIYACHIISPVHPLFLDNLVHPVHI